MVCTTVRKDKECPFMTTNGCSYNGGICHEVIEQCKGCNRGAQYASSWYCTACPDPTVKWKNGNCNLASHISNNTIPAKKEKINPLKASKRGNR